MPPLGASEFQKQSMLSMAGLNLRRWTWQAGFSQGQSVEQE